MKVCSTPQRDQRTLHYILSDCAVSKNKEKLIFLMDNDPSQRSKLATDALHDVGRSFRYTTKIA